MTLEAAGQLRSERAMDLVKTLDTVRDDASATATAAMLPSLAQKYGAAVKQFNATMAALSLSGQDEVVRQYLSRQPSGPAAEAKLIEKIEAVVNSPQSPILQPAINELFELWTQNATTGERRSLERLIDSKKLRR